MQQAGTGSEVILQEGKWKHIVQIDRKDKSDRTRYPLDLFNLEENVREAEEQNLIDDPAYKELIDTMFHRYNKIRDSGIPTYNL